MLSGHPHIDRVRVHEQVINGQFTQKLIVETNIDLSEKRSKKDASNLSKLEEFLKVLAGNDFADFREIEIRPSSSNEYGDDYGRNLVA